MGDDLLSDRSRGPIVIFNPYGERNARWHLADGTVMAGDLAINNAGTWNRNTQQITRNVFVIEKHPEVDVDTAITANYLTKGYLVLPGMILWCKGVTGTGDAVEDTTNYIQSATAGCWELYAADALVVTAGATAVHGSAAASAAISGIFQQCAQVVAMEAVTDDDSNTWWFKGMVV